MTKDGHFFYYNSYMKDTSGKVFTSNIIHPEYHLWDSWVYQDDDNKIHLFCLAIPNSDKDGNWISPAQRNNFQFHIHHFISNDDGDSWIDFGCFQQPETTPNNSDWNIWSGSVIKHDNGALLSFITGIYPPKNNKPFIQNISLALTDNINNQPKVIESPLSCSFRDWDAILSAGYYLDKKECLGHSNGEEGGAISCWRDPFAFKDIDGSIKVFWCAKVSAHQGALACATLEIAGDEYRFKSVSKPIIIPGAEDFTQVELPKIHYNAKQKLYYLIIATTNRLCETQPIDEVESCIRMYQSPELFDHWQPMFNNRGIVPNTKDYYGVSIIKENFENNQVKIMAPTTHHVNSVNRPVLGFSKSFWLNLESI